MERDYNCDLLKVRYKGEYYKLRLNPEKVYIAQRDPVFGFLKIKDELGEETYFEGDDFEAVKLLESAGMPDEEQ